MRLTCRFCVRGEHESNTKSLLYPSQLVSQVISLMHQLGKEIMMILSCLAASERKI